MTFGLTRRRFLAISAAFAATPAEADTSEDWRGRALGAEVHVRLAGPADMRREALAAARDALRRVEGLFSLYDPASALSVLNRTGRLDPMPPGFAELLSVIDWANDVTEGLFDPTVQTRLFGGGSGTQWGDIAKGTTWIEIPAEAALTFNGIAQGYATDRVSALLARLGFPGAMVHVGEYKAGDEPVRIGLADRSGHIFAETSLAGAALATSSPFSTVLADGGPHIQRPDGVAYAPVWDSVSVLADEAAEADALSTALAMTPDSELAAKLVSQGAAQRVWLRGTDGGLREIG